MPVAPPTSLWQWTIRLKRDGVRVGGSTAKDDPVLVDVHFKWSGLITTVAPGRGRRFVVHDETGERFRLCGPFSQRRAMKPYGDDFLPFVDAWARTGFPDDWEEAARIEYRRLRELRRAAPNAQAAAVAGAGGAPAPLPNLAAPVAQAAAAAGAVPAPLPIGQAAAAAAPRAGGGVRAAMQRMLAFRERMRGREGRREDAGDGGGEERAQPDPAVQPQDVGAAAGAGANDAPAPLPVDGGGGAVEENMEEIEARREEDGNARDDVSVEDGEIIESDDGEDERAAQLQVNGGAGEGRPVDAAAVAGDDRVRAALQIIQANLERRRREDHAPGRADEERNRQRRDDDVVVEDIEERIEMEDGPDADGDGGAVEEDMAEIDVRRGELEVRRGELEVRRGELEVRRAEIELRRGEEANARVNADRRGREDGDRFDARRREEFRRANEGRRHNNRVTQVEWNGATRARRHRCMVMMSSVPLDVTFNELSRFFAPLPIHSVERGVAGDRTRTSYVLVKFRTALNADGAMAFHGRLLRESRVQMWPTTRLPVRAISLRFIPF